MANTMARESEWRSRDKNSLQRAMFIHYVCVFVFIMYNCWSPAGLCLPLLRLLLLLFSFPLAQYSFHYFSTTITMIHNKHTHKQKRTVACSRSSTVFTRHILSGFYTQYTLRCCILRRATSNNQKQQQQQQQQQQQTQPGFVEPPPPVAHQNNSFVGSPPALSPDSYIILFFYSYSSSASNYKSNQCLHGARSVLVRWSHKK